MSEMTSADLGFVRRDVGLALLGALAFFLGWWVAGATDVGSTANGVAAFVALAGAVLALMRLIHLGYRLAFPRRSS